MVEKFRMWLSKVTSRKLPPPPAAAGTSPEAETAKHNAGRAVAAAEQRGMHVDRAVADLRRARLENNFGARLEYSYGLRSGKGPRHA